MLLKRWIDILGAATLLCFSIPLMLFIALAIAILDGRPVIFQQPRLGLGAIPFRFIKFKTMMDERDERGCLLDDKHRITNLGSLLRKTSLDELPQLWCVLVGDMSLVGPRPLLVEYLDEYPKNALKRHQMRPGITGLAQVQGRNQISWEEKFYLDVWYIDNFNLYLDAKILLKTIKVVMNNSNVSADGHATMPKFKNKTRNGGLR